VVALDPTFIDPSFDSRAENPTSMRRDFVIADGLEGPGRFLGCNVGVGVIDPCSWDGEGEVKFYRDGDGPLPTICGTGLEDYVGTAWGMGPHCVCRRHQPVPRLDIANALADIARRDYEYPTATETMLAGVLG
jgi:hypothetical protein